MAVKIERTSGEPREGVVGLRAPDGSIVESVRFYTDKRPLDDGGKMTSDEKAVCDGIVRDMSTAFHEYAEAAKKLERRGK
ncbi:MAG: hypothetical protein LBD02_01000 [Christensenellaceae bacterium]|jgi:hypothetical protein|nr:hypothetical protein [Christensenellaceae bacterium]